MNAVTSIRLGEYLGITETDSAMKVWEVWVDGTRFLDGMWGIRVNVKASFRYELKDATTYNSEDKESIFKFLTAIVLVGIGT